MVCAKRIQLKEKLCNSKIRGCCSFFWVVHGYVVDVCGGVLNVIRKMGKIFQIENTLLGNGMRIRQTNGMAKRREENYLVTNACNVSVSI